MDTNASNLPSYDATQEVRFAVVMFGGVSLAVYMNGITQELLNMVRATAPAAAAGVGGTETRLDRAAIRTNSALLTDEQLESTQRVYRKLGQALFHGRLPGAEASLGGPVRTRIVIDILSGTSAGGINAVYLAKALVNNQSLDELKQTWLGKADIDTLLNDARSDQSAYPVRTPPTSLLNSQRMYGLLYEAFEGMDANQPVGVPLAEELDLFVTMTDLNGMPAPISLADMMIEERVHKASFHFVYGPRRAGSPNDFRKPFNPMLACASRSTSSFPFAFEPMTLEDVDRMLPGMSLAIADRPDHPFRKFFAQFERNHPGMSFVRRPLADGGYLANKPFSFAVDLIKMRTASVPVCRKLLFLDPFPEMKSEVRRTRQNIDFLENTLDAASTLPRYQTICEDIERLSEYNRAVDAAQALGREIEEQSPERIRKCAKAPGTESYEGRGLSSMLDQHGDCFLAYHRLRVAAVTADLAELTASLLRLTDTPTNAYAMHLLIDAWRKERYALEAGEDRPTENYYLFEYDLGFRFRRADYVRNRIDKLLAALAAGDAGREGLTRLLRAALPEAGDAAAVLLANHEEAEAELYRLRDAVENVKWRLSYERESLVLAATGRDVGQTINRFRDELVVTLKATGLTPDDLAWVLQPVTAEECRQRAEILYATGERPGVAPRPISEKMREAAGQLAGWFGALFRNPEVNLRRELRRVSESQRSATGIVNEFAGVHYEFFDCRDMLSFTVLQDQLSGEASAVEIYRVSPLDAKRLRLNADPDALQKLAGDALFAFGAFLSHEWRENDILWGRLDGAERIIKALLPDEADEGWRNQLCDEAFRIIVEEEFRPHRTAELIGPLVDYLRQRIDPAGTKKLTADQFLRAALAEAATDEGSGLVRHLLRTVADDAARLEVFRAYYVKPPAPPISESLTRLRRALRIFGNMLKGLDGGEGPFARLGGLIANTGCWLARFAEFSIPQRVPNVFLRYWVQLLLAIGIVLVVGGAAFYQEVETMGWVVLGIAGATGFLSSLVARWLRRRPVGRLIAGVAGGVVLGVAIFFVLLARFQCYLPDGAWKAPLHAVLSMTDRRCENGKPPATK